MKALTYASAAFGALVALVFGGVWWWTTRKVDDAIRSLDLLEGEAL